MPIFKPGKGKWMKLCIRCNKPFIKTCRVQKVCEDCKIKAKQKKPIPPYLLKYL